MCLHRLAVVGNIDIGARGFCEEKYKASRTKFGVRSSVQKWVPSMRGLRSAEWARNMFFLLLESYIEVPVVKKHVLFSLSAVCFELNDFCLCCRLC